VDKAHQLKKSLQGQQKMISLYKNDSQLGTELSFKFSEAIAEKGKAFSDGEFVKHCLMILAERACPDKKYLMEQTGLSRFTMARRIDALSVEMAQPANSPVFGPSARGFETVL